LRSTSNRNGRHTRSSSTGLSLQACKHALEIYPALDFYMATPIPDEKLTEIEEALRQGRKIDAIKLYREYTGAGLAEAKAAVEELESRSPSAPGAPVNSAEPLPGVKAAVLRGEKIAAIMLYREQSGAGLREAKVAVEKIEAELRAKSPDKFTAAASGKGCLGMLAAVCVLVVAIVLWLAEK